MFRHLRHHVPRLGRATRLCLAAGCLLLAALSAVTSRAVARSPAAAGTPVVVAARPLAAGHTVTLGDLSVHRLPASAVPVGSRGDPAGLAGRRLAGAVTAGEPITAARLLGRGLVSGLPAGTLAVAVSVADPHIADLVRAGDRVDLVTGGPATDLPAATVTSAPGGRVVAIRLLVLACARDVESGKPRTALVVAADRATAVHIAATAAAQDLAALGVSS